MGLFMKSVRIEKKVLLWILLTVVAIIPFSLYFLQKSRIKDHKGISSGEVIFSKWNSEEVKQIVLTGNGRSKSFFFENGRWVYKNSEGDFPAKNNACDYIIETIAGLSSSNLLFKEIERPHLYGLTDEGGYQIEFKDKNLKTLTSVRVGLPLDESPFNYLSIEGQPEIYRVERTLADLSMGSSLLDLRIFPEFAGAVEVSEFQISAIVDNPDFNYILEQNENNSWSLNGESFTGSKEITGFINHVIDWQGESFVGIDRTNWNDAPLTIQIVNRDGRSAILHIGEEIDKGAFAVKRQDSDLVYRLTVESVSQLKVKSFFKNE